MRLTAAVQSLRTDKPPQYGLMSDVKLPIQTQWDPSRSPVTGSAAASDMFVQHIESFDFRSSRFCADAMTLARATGRALQRCRQELFMAEGDMGLAYELLLTGYDGEPVVHTLH